MSVVHFKQGRLGAAVRLGVDSIRIGALALLLAAGAAWAAGSAVASPAVGNVKFQQRYPWNGLVDISFDLTGRNLVKIGVTALTNGVEVCKASALEGREFAFGQEDSTTNGVHLVWNATEDLPADFKGEAFKLRVTAQQIVSDYQVQYLEIGSEKTLATAKSVTDVNVESTVSESAPTVENYDLTGDATKTLKIARDSAQNVIKFYYQRATSSYTVRYLESGTEKVLAPERTISPAAVGSVVDVRAITIDDYALDGDKVQSVTIVRDATANLVIFHYVAQ